jgi:hypothetical protein
MNIENNIASFQALLYRCVVVAQWSEPIERERFVAQTV